jgi:DNA-directed RNA polymerase subunit beta'
MFDENNIVAIDKLLITSVAVRSPLICEAENGFCVMCYGRDLARGKLVSIGEAVGIIAAQSIGEPGTQLTMRTFHIGGTASSKIEETSWKCQKPGQIILDGVNTVINRDKVQVVVDQNSEVRIVNDEGRDIDRLKLPLGAKIFFKHKDKVEKDDIISEWDPFSVPIISNAVGVVKFCDIEENKSMIVKTDDNTGISREVIIENYEYDLKPSIALVDKKGKNVLAKGGKALKNFDLPVRSELVVKDGDEVMAGDILAKIPRESAKTKDITGGLPRVVDLLEARVPKSPCQVTEIGGKVEIGENIRRKKKIIIHPDVGKPKSYLINRGDFIRVMDGEIVKAGDLLTDGIQNPHDILRIKGLGALQKYLVNEVLEVYRMQGVKINDKHVEVITTHMLKKVKIIDPGDSVFLKDREISRSLFQAENKRLELEGKRKAEAKPILLGITQASLSTDSFISAASFQETTKVLTAAAAGGKTDYFKNPKENVILGRLIPVGTGFHYNKKEYDYKVDQKIKDEGYVENEYVEKDYFIKEEQAEKQ